MCGFFAVKGPEGKSLRPPGKKPAALLAYLAYRRGKKTTRDRLVDLFWSDRGQKQGQDSLRQAIYVIRHALHHQSATILISDRNYIALDRDQISYDLWREDGSIHESVHDELLEDLDFISPVFDDWLLHARRDVRNRQISRAERLLAGGDPDVAPEEALDIAKIILKLDPTNEPAARMAISIHAKRDEIGHGHRIIQALQKRLQDDGLDISEKTQSLYNNVISAPTDVKPHSELRAKKPKPETVTDLPLVEVGMPVGDDNKSSTFDLSEEFFDRLVSRMIQMPELRVRALGTSDTFSHSAFSLRLLPSVKNDETRIVLRLSSGDGEAFWASHAPVTLHPADEHIEAQVDKSVIQIISAIEENIYRHLKRPPMKTMS
ncbi:hypothetical protein thalar_02503 [Litoreibacter arenae DSM 19593]|uniref:Bacterial transcriptional activator domain-containing protein n=2 Tax=Litoreibacter TaxID=947567 RepID=S9RW86_9RHOB|nr:hypothetical protein thalar_02503 [Litoreibacter arenae DSM 19593]